MSQTVPAFIKRVLLSHLGHILLAVSWCFILFVLVRPSMNRPFFVDCVPTKDELFWITEVNHSFPIWTVIIGIAHFPSILVTQAVMWLVVKGAAISCMKTAKLELAVFFIASSIQWLLIGYSVESFVRWIKLRKNDHRIQQALGADSP